MANFMFEYVHLKNYKSFDDLTFSLLDRYGKPKKMILIYGENGIGKSNLASIFYVFSQTLNTLNSRDFMQALMDNNPDIKSLDNDFLQHVFRFQYPNMEALIKSNKMIDSEDNMLLEFGFILDGRKGRYILETDDKELVHERLEYVLTKNRGSYFDITPDKHTISSKIFNTKSAYSEIKSSCVKYWGKHTLLSILMHESQDKADSYILNQISDNFSSLVKYFNRISCRINVGGHYENGRIRVPRGILQNFESGRIKADSESILDKTEVMLNAYLKDISKDTAGIYYKRTINGNHINYELMHQKRIAGKIRDIAFSLESTGMQSLIEILPYMLVTACGSTVIIDEFDMGVHDILVDNLVKSMYSNLSGQLIMTTHSLALMEASIPRDCFYVINEDISGHKQIEPITSIDPSIHKNTSVLRQYTSGKYGAIPHVESIDFDHLLSKVGVDADSLM